MAGLLLFDWLRTCLTVQVCDQCFIVAPCLCFDDIYSYLKFISLSYAFTLMMLEGQFPIESQVGFFGVIANNSAKFAKANFGGVI